MLQLQSEEVQKCDKEEEQVFVERLRRPAAYITARRTTNFTIIRRMLFQ